MGHRAAKTQLFDSKVRLTKKHKNPSPPLFMTEEGREKEALLNTAMKGR